MFDKFFNLHCPDCGKTIAEDDMVCPHCGLVLESPTDQAEELAAANQYYTRAKEAFEAKRSLKQALEDINQAIEYRDDIAEFHDLLGQILEYAGKTEQALAAFKEAERLSAGQGDISPILHTHSNEAPDEPFINESGNKPFNKGDEISGMSKIFLVLTILVFTMMLIQPAAGALQDILNPQSTIIFVPIPDKNFDVSSQYSLKNTAQILTKRAHKLGFQKTTFNVYGMNEISGRVPSNTDIQDFVNKISVKGLVEFVDLGRDPPGIGVIIETDLEDLNNKKTYHWPTILTNAGIGSTDVGKNKNENFQIFIFLNDSGKKLYYEFAAKNIGSYIGIVLDKKIVSTIKIANANSDKPLVVNGNFTEFEAYDLASKIGNQDVLPIFIKISKTQ
jgi:tetratricopeptide (TPR) repeat protein